MSYVSYVAENPDLKAAFEASGSSSAAQWGKTHWEAHGSGESRQKTPQNTRVAASPQPGGNPNAVHPSYTPGQLQGSNVLPSAKTSEALDVFSLGFVLPSWHQGKAQVPRTQVNRQCGFHQLWWSLSQLLWAPLLKARNHKAKAAAKDQCRKRTKHYGCKLEPVFFFYRERNI